MSLGAKFYRILFPVIVCGLFLYLFNFKERIANSPKFIVGSLVDYTCWEGRSKGDLNLVIESNGISHRVTTSLFGQTSAGWIQCKDLNLSEKLGQTVIFGETGVSWDYLKIGKVEIHSLQDLVEQINSMTSTTWNSEINWKQVRVPNP